MGGWSWWFRGFGKPWVEVVLEQSVGWVVYLGLLCWRGEKDDEVERERRLGMAMVWGEGAGFQGMGIDFGEKMKKKEKDEGVGGVLS